MVQVVQKIFDPGSTTIDVPIETFNAEESFNASFAVANQNGENDWAGRTQEKQEELRKTESFGNTSWILLNLMDEMTV